MDKSDWVKRLELLPHPEGGWYKEIHRSDEEILTLPERYSGKRNYFTSIYFLLGKEDKSHFHILSSDELWYWHGGGSGIVHTISASGNYKALKIGPEPDAQLQILIPRGHWFAAEVIEGDFLLVSCAVAPGFDFVDFVLGKKEELLYKYPQHEKLIEKFSLT